jgi:DNA (cytosine-5)-methyltransferase 1
MFSWKWYLKDIKASRPVKVFSCFSCGGGSSLGYKRCGFEVIGNCEIDPSINEIYCRNNHPKYSFCMDIRDFKKKQDLPEELYHLDILDGSPPCTTFSSLGDRDDALGKKKKFAEGQKEQRLDDLFFEFIDVVDKLRPKIVVAENVTGLLTKSNRCYVNEIIRRFKQIGYDVQLFHLNAAFMDVPQSRNRAFFVANRMQYKKLKLIFNNDVIPFSEVKEQHGLELNQKCVTAKLLNAARATDKTLSDVYQRECGKSSFYTCRILHDNEVCPCLTTSSAALRYCDRTAMTDGDLRNVSSFPQDYDFNGKCTFITGMCVPPNMMANVANQIWEQWLKDEQV